MMWSNLHLLFWISLIPFVTGWMGEHSTHPTPTALYGVVLLMAGIAYRILQSAIVASEGEQSALAATLGSDYKGRISLIVYAAAIPSAFISCWIAWSLYALIAILWIVPDRRIERALKSL
jgi:uncharacterized membrane protein